MSKPQPPILTLEKLKELTPSRVKRRGRPRPATVSEAFETKGFKVASAVHNRIAGGEPKASAIRSVADQFQSSEAAVRQALKENQKQTTAATIAKLAHTLAYGGKVWSDLASEVQRRGAGLPEDIRESISSMSAVDFVDAMRTAGIDGTCPAWLLNLVRRARHLGPEVVAAMIVRAANDPDREVWLDNWLIQAADLTPQEYNYQEPENRD